MFPRVNAQYQHDNTLCVRKLKKFLDQLGLKPRQAQHIRAINAAAMG